MTVAENVQMALISRARPHARRGGPTRAASTARRRWRCSIASAWRDDADRPCSELAYGDVKRVELAIALAGAPKLLLMDEPTAGMAPQGARQLMQLTAGIARERGIGVLFTEHDMDAVFAPRRRHHRAGARRDRRRRPAGRGARQRARARGLSGRSGAASPRQAAGEAR